MSALFAFLDTRHESVSKSVYVQRSKSNDYPCTPPPSPRERRSSNMFNEENLVHISVILYSKDSEQFFTKKLSPTICTKSILPVSYTHLTLPTIYSV